MQFGIILPTDEAVHGLVDLGVAAEAAGWDGVFVWDSLEYNDPWITLAAIAAQTQRVRLGPVVTPPSRRKPWELAQQTATLDRLSGGRLILPVGLGAPDTGFGRIGEETDRRRRAEMLDESLAILAGLWSGQPFQFAGQHYQIREDWAFRPTPVQQPRIPVWVVAVWPRPRSLARAAQWDGVLAMRMDAPGGSMEHMTAPEVAELRAWLAAQRPDNPPAIILESPMAAQPTTADALRPFAEAGLSWWLENVWVVADARQSLAAMMARVQAGPPRPT